jgi:hypothetical protein
MVMKHYSPVAPDFTQELGLVLTCTSVRLRLKDRQAIATGREHRGEDRRRDCSTGNGDAASAVRSTIRVSRRTDHRNCFWRIKGGLTSRLQSVGPRGELAIHAHGETLVEDHCHIARADLHFAFRPRGKSGKLYSESVLEFLNHAVIDRHFS